MNDNVAVAVKLSELSLTDAQISLSAAIEIACCLPVHNERLPDKLEVTVIGAGQQFMRDDFDNLNGSSAHLV